MPFTVEQQDRIKAALQARAPVLNRCSLCGQNAGYNLPDGFAFLVLQDNVATVNLTGNGVPVVPITCNNCGNTLLLNLVVLGLADMISTAPKKEVQPQ